VSNIFQHANIKLKYGILNYIFSTNELHRWHHSTELKEANNNYGAVLVVWDLVFGTFYQKAELAPSQLGLAEENAYPVNSYWKQLLVPFFWKRWVYGAPKIKEVPLTNES